MGSPPQVRGKHGSPTWEEGIPGITPAGAGKTLHGWIMRALLTDHPRRCGENSETCSAAYLHPGSPPQVRGKLFSETLCYTHTRITPAGAGKTRKFPAHTVQVGDHPRRCGENLKSCVVLELRLGSPPQVRGKH